MGFVYFCIPVIGGYFIMEVRSCLRGSATFLLSNILEMLTDRGAKGCQRQSEGKFEGNVSRTNIRAP
jgi:hypothetical protein